jgi:hypothetical protein
MFAQTWSREATHDVRGVFDFYSFVPFYHLIEPNFAWKILKERVLCHQNAKGMLVLGQMALSQAGN